jgi:hypothetical protein
MLGQALEHVTQVSLDVRAVQLRGSQQTVDGGEARSPPSSDPAKSEFLRLCKRKLTRPVNWS